MPQTTEEVEDDGSKNMVSNLPLLFADGYPTSLDKITEKQLEKFIPFMVQCSLGNVTIHSMTEFNKPPWWPKDLEFTKPFKRPKSFAGDWLLKMRELVVACYDSHDNIYLLRYCADLAKFQPTALRFINNYNSTTSLFERSTNKLLVTFRNENMLYDQEQKINSRKCLLPKQSNSQSCLATPEEMVISEGFEIYLCDYCDAELYSYGAMVEHEKASHSEQSNAELGDTSDDDDVIFCGRVLDDQLPLDAAARAQAQQQKMVSFLSQNFMLRCTNDSSTPSASICKPSSNSAEVESSGTTVESTSAGGKYHRLPRRSRQVITLAKCTQIPLSSPLGLFMLKSSKVVPTPEYLLERFERMERFCIAPSLPPGISYPLRPGLLNGGSHEPGTTIHDRRMPKWLFGKVKSSGPNGCPVTFKRLADDSCEPSKHQYKIPRRQFFSQQRIDNFLFYNKPLLERCRPCLVNLQRLTAAEMQELSQQPGIEREKREAELAALQELQRRKELAEIAESAMVIDSIDLCSSDDELQHMEEGKLVVVSDDDTTNAYHHHLLQDDSSSSEGEYFSHDAIETIVLEMDDSMGNDTNELTNTSFYANRCTTTTPPKLNASSDLSKDLLVPTFAKKSFASSLLSESAYRLNQSLPPAGHASNGKILDGSRQPLTAPLYLYANCSQTAVSLSEESQFPSGNRAMARKGTSLPLKENLENGFGATGNGANGDTVLLGASTAVPVHNHHQSGTVQSRATMLLPAPIVNGHAIITNGTIPVAFASSRASAAVVQTLSTTTTYVNQAIHMSMNHNSSSATAAVSSTTAANLQ
ncbi:uncharacterized protein LOC126557126 [Anopheles maculipalpis]|uniref:uncharacterized protein LOC126557126 n=1 Tax=Anopheles maculipalpis TaxID=1496333 RepID=UPI00215990B6|nr:uncharacterized protein LOC126557126 [Anopheles maculipalpis]